MTSLRVLEKTDRIGGKCLTDQFAGVGTPLGATFLGPRYDRITAILHELSLQDETQRTKHIYGSGGLGVDVHLTFYSAIHVLVYFPEFDPAIAIWHPIMDWYAPYEP